MAQGQTITLDKNWWKKKRPASKKPLVFVGEPRKYFKSDAFFTTAEIAERLKFGEDHVYRLLRRKQLRGEKLGKEWRVYGQDVNEWIARENAGRAERACGNLSYKYGKTAEQNSSSRSEITAEEL